VFNLSRHYWAYEWYDEQKGEWISPRARRGTYEEEEGDGDDHDDSDSD